MDLAKFISLLKDSVLHFARSDNLGDPFEGSITLREATNAERLIAFRNAGGRLPDFYNTWTDEDIRRIAKDLADRRRGMTKEVYVNCWHLNEVESAAMWSLYAKSGEAVSIQANYANLAEALPEWSHLGKVRYHDFASIQPIGAQSGSVNILSPFIYKRVSYEHEREVRALVWDTGTKETMAARHGNGLRVSVDLNNLISAVYISPAASEWFYEVAADVTQRYGLNCPVLQSDLNGMPLYGPAS